MTWRSYLLLATLGLMVSLFFARFEPFPGYLDSDYYFGGGIQLAQGHGFNEPYVWNYLDNPQSLPHPSHSYWMPLASIVAALGLVVLHQTTYTAGRLGFLVFAMLVPVVTAALAYDFSKRRDLAVVSGVIAIFSIYYAPFIPVTDNYGIYIVLGGLYFLLSTDRRPRTYFVLGLIAGLLTLARSDGLLWIGVTALLILGRFVRDHNPGESVMNLALALVGFLLIVSPWFWRNEQVYGAILAPGGHYLLWLKNYDETFVYPASQLTMQSWLAQGWQNIVAVRLEALRINLLNAFAAQGGIFLFPFILVGIWKNRRDERVQFAGLAWLVLLFVMTFLFPFAGPRGGFFHSGAALQSLWWSLAPLGLEYAVDVVRRRGWLTLQAYNVFRFALAGIAVVMTGLIFYLRVLQPGWGEDEQIYPKVEAVLRQNGVVPADVVMVRNPPGYYLMTGRAAIVIPYGDENSLLDAARRFHARFVAIEAAGASGPIETIYNEKDDPSLRFLSQINEPGNDTRIFEIQP
ncbi:MAG TPA: hypothetical protein VLX61_16185 [Anaerolineales bacterium]|nr:hypothetical protein [Anaerolineales bacterium]